MPVIFPDTEAGLFGDIVAVGGNLEPRTLLAAYRQGIFPWPHDASPQLIWASPEMRGVLFFDELHVPRSLRKRRERTALEFTFDKDFPAVIRSCASARRSGEPGTWLSAQMIAAFEHFHELGYAHSVEAWEGKELAGGLYGTTVDGVFSGESMFHKRPDASKLALLHLVDYLKSRGATWLDIQVMTPHMEILRARAIPRREFIKMLREEQKKGRTLF